MEMFREYSTSIWMDGQNEYMQNGWQLASSHHLYQDYNFRKFIQFSDVLSCLS